MYGTLKLILLLFMIVFEIVGVDFWNASPLLINITPTLTNKNSFV